MISERFPSREEIASQIQTRQVILLPDDSLIEIDHVDTHSLKDVLIQHGFSSDRETEGKRRISTELTKRMIELEWIDYEKSSGKGHFRYYPKGAVIHSILERMMGSYALNSLMATPIQTPLLFNWEDAQIQQEAGTFYDNLYHVKAGSDQKGLDQVLRFGGDFGVFKLMQNAQLEEEQLPIRIYEAGNVFRSSKSGEIQNIQRAESFFLPAVYSFCKNDLQASVDEFACIHNSFSQFLTNLGLEYSHTFEINNAFFNEHRDKIVSILRYDNKAALIKLASGKRHYYEMKSCHVVQNEFNSFNLQLDNENGRTYDIKYHLKSNDNVEHCMIVQSALATVQRWMLIFLNEALRENGQGMPAWLAPVQIRIIPLDEEFMNTSIIIAQQLISSGIRADVDNRNGRINKKIKKASSDLIPFVVLWGKEENNTQAVKIRSRDGYLAPCSLEELPLYINSKINSSCPRLDYFPHLPITVSKLPKFS